VTDWPWPAAWAVGAAGCTLAGTFVYRRLAVKRAVFAVPNERTLHDGIVPTGAGLVFSVVYLSAVAVAGLVGFVPASTLALFLLGGACITAVGVIDDQGDLSRRVRLGVHVALAIGTLVVLGGVPAIDVLEWTLRPGVVGTAIAVFVLTWFVSLYNFMDGVDGMAASGTLFFTLFGGIFVYLQGRADLALFFSVLAGAMLGFLVFNWPPARVFMGDTGSGFLGFVVYALALMTIVEGVMSYWTWTILLGYYLTDTGLTVLLRLKREGKDFYKTHRQHAYQNLARVWQSHLAITGLVNAIHAGWLFPLALWSVFQPNVAPLLAFLALAPIAAFVWKYGPLYEERSGRVTGAGA
jgi:Fuc2NAc and GlcNAc transferase